MKSLRVALLSLVRSPEYSLASTVLVAIGVATLATVFAVTDVLLLRPLRYENPGELYFLSTQHQPDGANFPPSVADFRDYERAVTSFDAMGITYVANVVLPTRDGAESHRVAYASSGWLRALRVRPLLGRGFTADDNRADAPTVLILSYESWQKLFAGDSTIINRALATAQGALTVIGVLPPMTMYPSYAIGLSALEPYAAQHAGVARRDARIGTLGLVRLSADATRSSAQAQLTAISRQLSAAHPATNTNWGASLEPLRVVVSERFRNPTLLLLGGAVLVLIIAATNVAVLSIVRSAARAHEGALRRALGARVFGTLAPRMLETSLVVTAGAILGLVLAKWALGVIGGSLTNVLTKVSMARLDAVSVLVALAGAVVCLLFGFVVVIPQAFGRNLLQRLKPAAAQGRGSQLAGQNLLVVSQVAFSLILALAGLSIAVASLTALREGPGIDVHKLISVPVEPPQIRNLSPSAQQAFIQQLRDRLLAVPGVENVGLINHAPLTQAGVLTAVELSAGPGPSSSSEMAVYRSVDERYFAAAGQPVLEGRAFSAADMHAGSRNVLVNQSFAHKFWPGASAVGQNVRVFDQSPLVANFNAPLDVTIIGVVRDVKDWGFSRPPLPAVYVPFTVSPWPTAAFAIRATAPRHLMQTVRRVFSAMDPLLPLSGARLGEELVAESEAPRRAAMWIVIAFGVTATLLAGFGIYAVIAQQVVRRARETGIRLAVGGTARGVVARFVAGALVLCSAGLAVGLALTPAVRGALAAATPTPITLSWTTVATGSLAVLAVVALAAFLAALRSTRTSPVNLMRAE